jgi:hypothetical protein
MPPHTSPFALIGAGADVVGLGLIQVLPLLGLAHYLALGGAACGVLGAVMGLVALAHIARNPKRIEGRPMAIASVVVGGLEVVGYLVVFALGARGFTPPAL